MPPFQLTISRWPRAIAASQIKSDSKCLESDSDFDDGNGVSSHANGNDYNDEDLQSLFVLHFGSLQSLPDPGSHVGPWIFFFKSENC